MGSARRDTGEHRDLVVDATERRRGRLMKVLARISAEGVVVLDSDLGATHVSLSAQRTLRRTRSELLGQMFWRALSAPDRTPTRDAIRSLARAGGRQMRREVTVLVPDGGQVTLEITAAPEPTEDGPFAALLTLRDVTVERDRERQLAREMSWFRAITDHCADLVMVLEPRRDGRFRHRFVSEAAQRILGLSAEELMESSDSVLIHPEDMEHHRAAVHETAATPGAVVSVAFRARHTTGHWVHLESRLVNRLDDPHAPAIVATVRDVGARVAEVEAARARLEWLSTVAGQNADVMYVFDAQGGMLFASPSTERLLGYRPDEIDERVAAEIVHPADHDELGAAFARAAESPDTPITTRYRARHRDGRLLHLESVITNMLHVETVRGTVVTTRNVSGRALQHPSGMPSRQRLADRLEERWHRIEGPVVIGVAEGRAAQIASARGPGAVRTWTQTIGRLLREARVGELVAQLNDWHFAILLREGTDPNTAVQRLLATVDRPIDVEGGAVHPALHLAILHADAFDDARGLLLSLAATIAEAERTSARVIWHAADASITAARQLEFQELCREAVVHGRFELHYQPIVRTDTLAVTGFEALIRPHDRGLEPGRFVAMAEELGLAVPLGRRVLGRAIRDAARLAKTRPDVGVSVNASAHELLQPGFATLVRSLLAQAGISPRLLTIELTETALLDRPEAARRTIDALRTAGVRVCLDDFGTGFSSLSHLHAFAIDGVKIDRSFVRDLGTKLASRAVVEAVGSIATRLGMTAVAEGVENAEQLAWVRDAGCARSQGWLHGRAMPLDDALALADPLRT